MSKNWIAFVAITFSTLLLAACDKKKNNPEDQLPPATRQGANTFGCLVNGEVFKPRKHFATINIMLKTDYTYTEEGWYGIVRATDYVTNPSNSISIKLNGFKVEQDIIINLHPEVWGYASIKYYIGSPFNPNTSFVPDSSGTSGQIHITYINWDRRIMAGTFWFDGFNPAGEKVEVRAGRFDVTF